MSSNCLIAVAIHSRDQADIRGLEDLQGNSVNEIERFSSSNNASKGKRTHHRRGDGKRSPEYVEEGMKRQRE